MFHISFFVKVQSIWSFDGHCHCGLACLLATSGK